MYIRQRTDSIDTKVIHNEFIRHSPHRAVFINLLIFKSVSNRFLQLILAIYICHLPVQVCYCVETVHDTAACMQVLREIDLTLQRNSEKGEKQQGSPTNNSCWLIGLEV